MNIAVIFQDDEPEGEFCSACHELIEVRKWVMMVQVGGPEDAIPMDYVLCDKCYFDNIGREAAEKSR